MNRSRSKSRLLETAFVSQSRSSTEDLDEVDRLANHPMLRPSPVPETYTLGNRRGQQNRAWRPFRSSMRKSRSEMGGYGSDTGGGFSIAKSQPILDSCNTASCQNSANINRKESQKMTSYTPPAEFGCRTVAVGMMRGNGSRLLQGNLSRMKRSTTINFQQFYSSQTSDEQSLDNINSNHIENQQKNVSNSISSISGFNCDNVKRHDLSATYNMRNSPSSSYWSDWTGGNEEGNKAVEKTQGMINSNITVNDAVTYPPHNKLAEEAIDKEHYTRNTVSDTNYNENHTEKVTGDIVVTSAVVEYYNKSNSISEDSNGSNNEADKCYSPANPTTPNTVGTCSEKTKSIARNDRTNPELSATGRILSKTKEVRWNTEKSQTEHRIKKYPSNQQNIHHDSIEKCEIKVAPVSTLGQDNTTTTDTTGSYVSSASNIDISSTSMRDEGEPNIDNSGLPQNVEVDHSMNNSARDHDIPDNLPPKKANTYQTKLSLSNLISPPLPKFRLLPISLAHRRIKGNDKNKKLSGKKIQNESESQQFPWPGSTPSNSSSADSTPQKNKQETKAVAKPANRSSLSFDRNNLQQFVVKNNCENEKRANRKKLDLKDSNSSSQRCANNILNIENHGISPTSSPVLSNEQLRKPPAPPRPKRAIVMKQLLLEKKAKEKRNSLFSSAAEEENDSDEEESCSFVSSLESMKSFAESGGSTSDGIQSLISSAESGVAALGGHSSTGTGCGGSMSSRNSSATDLNVPQLTKDRTPNKSQFRIEQRASGFINSSSHIISRQYVIKGPQMDLRQYHNSMIRPLLSSSKFPVLSPISDKSQEQCPSEVGESQQCGNSNSNITDNVSSHTRTPTESINSQNKTPKISPTDQILAACCVGGSKVEETDGVDDVTFVSFKQQPSHMDFGDHSTATPNTAAEKLEDEDDCSLYVSGNNNTHNYNISSLSDTNKDAEQLKPAPFSMPKLERRLQQEKERRKQTTNIPFSNRSFALSNIYNNNNNKGSDSGISMAGSSSHGGYSGDSSNEQGGNSGGPTSAQDMFQLLQDLPFDMPKLRRKTQQILSSRILDTTTSNANNLPTETTSSSVSPFLTRILPPRPNSVPNQTIGSSILIQQQQYIKDSSSNGNESIPSRAVQQINCNNDEKRIDNGNLAQNAAGHQRIEPQRDVPLSFDIKTLEHSKVRPTGATVGKSNIKTHSEIYQKFAEETEKQQKDYDCHNNNENNDRNQNQDLHFAKRLTWNLPITEDKMQTSTDGNETPVSEINNTNLNLFIPHSASSNQFQNNQGATPSSSAWDNGQASNLQYYSQENHASQENRAGNDVIHNESQTFHSNASNEESTNGNAIHSLRNTFQLNIPSQRTLNSQANVPKYCNTSTSNLNLNAMSQKKSALGFNSFDEPSNRIVNPHNIAPPPPGFEDNEFYLTETQPIAQENAKNNIETQPNFKLGGRRQRPKMTLSFAGFDSPSDSSSSTQISRTLMFATNSPFPLNDCIEVDPNLSIERQDWYHGSITRNEAEDLLRNHQEGSYLVRNVDAVRQEYALCLKSALGYMHMSIRRDPKERNFQLCDFNRRSITIPEMIHHYTLNRLPIKGAEHMCLKSPVLMQLL